MNTDKEAQTIEVLNEYIHQYRATGLQEVLKDCNVFGNPELNFLYVEIYHSCTNEQYLLGLSGSGMFLELLTNEIWISTLVHKAQLENVFKSWDDVMQFIETKYGELENQKLSYFRDIKPIIQQILDPKDLNAIELTRDFVRNTYIHSKRIKLLDTLSRHGVIPSKISAGKATIKEGRVVKVEEKLFSPTHPLVNKIGFTAIARQLAPAMLIFIFEMFKKYHKHMAPLKDDLVKFSGHNCEYD